MEVFNGTTWKSVRNVSILQVFWWKMKVNFANALNYNNNWNSIHMKYYNINMFLICCFLVGGGLMIVLINYLLKNIVLISLSCHLFLCRSTWQKVNVKHDFSFYHATVISWRIIREFFLYWINLDVEGDGWESERSLISPHTSASSVSPCDRTSPTPAGTSIHGARWSYPCNRTNDWSVCILTQKTQTRFHI